MSDRRLVWIETCPAADDVCPYTSPPNGRLCHRCGGTGEIRPELTEDELVKITMLSRPIGTVEMDE